jgi:hypothetical protein
MLIIAKKPNGRQRESAASETQLEPGTPELAERPLLQAQPVAVSECD